MARNAFAAEFEPAPGNARRRAWRVPVSIDAALERSGVDRAICHVADLSRYGARLSAYSEFRPGALIWLTLPGGRRLMARVRWATGFDAGCEFAEPIAAELCRALGGDPD